jgi:hypothetical protein
MQGGYGEFKLLLKRHFVLLLSRLRVYTSKGQKDARSGGEWWYDV